MTTEELLKPRIKVIAPWPGMEDDDYEVGQIYTGTEEDLNISMIEMFPHLFKRLEWWEERDKKDMPDYVKQTGMVDSFDNPVPDWYLKVKKHFNCGTGEWRDDSFRVFCAYPDNRTIGTNMNYSGFEPATESEYQSFIQR